MGFGVPKILKPPKIIRKVAKAAVTGAAKGVGASLGGPAGAEIAASVSGTAFDSVMGDNKKGRKAKKAAASRAATSSGGSTDVAMRVEIGTHPDDPTARKPTGFFEILFSIFG